jgi:hypothetical protein
MSIPAVEHPRVTWNDAFRFLLMGLVFGACYGTFVALVSKGYEGVFALAVLERAAKSGIATATGYVVAGTAAGRVGVAALLGGIFGGITSAVLDRPIVLVALSVAIFGALGLADRWYLAKCGTYAAGTVQAEPRDAGSRGE